VCRLFWCYNGTRKVVNLVGFIPPWPHVDAPKPDGEIKLNSGNPKVLKYTEKYRRSAEISKEDKRSKDKAGHNLDNRQSRSDLLKNFLKALGASLLACVVQAIFKFFGLL
jgi:hypothetical protein